MPPQSVMGKWQKARIEAQVMTWFEEIPHFLLTLLRAICPRLRRRHVLCPMRHLREGRLATGEAEDLATALAECFLAENV